MRHAALVKQLSMVLSERWKDRSRLNRGKNGAPYSRAARYNFFGARMEKKHATATITKTGRTSGIPVGGLPNLTPFPSLKNYHHALNETAAMYLESLRAQYQVFEEEKLTRWLIANPSMGEKLINASLMLKKRFGKDSRLTLLFVEPEEQGEEEELVVEIRTFEDIESAMGKLSRFSVQWRKAVDDGGKSRIVFNLRG